MSEKSSCPWIRAWGPRAQTPQVRHDGTVELPVSWASDQNPPAQALKLFNLGQAPFGSACCRLKAFSAITSCRACIRLPHVSRQRHGRSHVSIWRTMKVGAGRSEAAASLRGLHAIRLARQDDHGSPLGRAERRIAAAGRAWARACSISRVWAATGSAGIKGMIRVAQAILSSGYGTTRRRGAATVSER
jgi:hypothetical protein